MTCFKEEGRFALLAFSCFEGIFEFMKNQFWAKELRYTDCAKMKDQKTLVL
jgi:hypothetical protein